MVSTGIVNCQFSIDMYRGSLFGQNDMHFLNFTSAKYFFSKTPIFLSIKLLLNKYILEIIF